MRLSLQVDCGTPMQRIDFLVHKFVLLFNPRIPHGFSLHIPFFFFFFPNILNSSPLETFIAFCGIAIQLFFFFFLILWSLKQAVCGAVVWSTEKSSELPGLGIMFGFYQRCGYLQTSLPAGVVLLFWRNFAKTTTPTFLGLNVGKTFVYIMHWKITANVETVCMLDKGWSS